MSRTRSSSAAGADEVIGYEGFGDRAREISGGEGAAVVYDRIRRTTLAEGLEALRPTGSMIVYGAATGGPEPPEGATPAGKGSP